MLSPLLSTGETILPLIVMVIGLSITLIYLLYRYEGKKITKRKNLKVKKSVRQEEFECPRCGENVDGETHACPGCGAEFEKDTFLCPVCGIVVSDDDDKCPDCGEVFIAEEREFECPDCGKSVDQYARECKACGASFWSPVKRSHRDIKGEEETNDGKLDASIIEILED